MTPLSILTNYKSRNLVIPQFQGIKKATILSMIAFLKVYMVETYFAGKNLPIKIRTFLTNFKSGIRESFKGNSGESTLAKLGIFDLAALSTFDVFTIKKQTTLNTNINDLTMSLDFF